MNFVFEIKGDRQTWGIPLEMQLEIHSYLGRDERVQCYNAPTLFQNLLKRFLTCRVSTTMPNCPVSRIITNDSAPISITCEGFDKTALWV